MKAKPSELEVIRASEGSCLTQDTLINSPHPSCTHLTRPGGFLRESIPEKDICMERKEYGHLRLECTQNGSRVENSILEDELQDMRTEMNASRKKLHQTVDEVQHLRGDLERTRDELEKTQLQLRKEVQEAHTFAKENFTAAQNTVLQCGT